MAEQPAPEFDLLGDVAAKAVIGIIDRYCAQIGVPSYTALADARIAEIQGAAQLLAHDAQRLMAAEIYRLREAHGLIASQCRAAIVALERQDLLAADDLLTQSAGTAALHGRNHDALRRLPANVVSIDAARVTRRLQDFGRL